MTTNAFTLTAPSAADTVAVAGFPSVVVGGRTFTANKSPRSQKAIASIQSSLDRLGASGFVVSVTSWSKGVMSVYIYADKLPDTNSTGEAAYAFRYRTMSGTWFCSHSAIQESLASGLKVACEELGLI